MSNIPNLVDVIAEPNAQVEVEIQPEFGFGKSHRKLYIHVNGITIFRMCKVEEKNITINVHSPSPTCAECGGSMHRINTMCWICDNCNAVSGQS